MSSAQVLPLAGAAVGFVGSGMNPAGAMAGYQLGSAAGGLVNKGSPQQAAAAPNIVSPGVIQEPGGSLLSGFPSVGGLSGAGQEMAKIKNAASDVPGAPGKAASMEGTVGMVAQEYARQKQAQQANELVRAQIDSANRQGQQVVSAPHVAAVDAMGGALPHLQPQFSFLGRR